MHRLLGTFATHGEVASAPCVFHPTCRVRALSVPLILSELTAEIALFAAAGGLLFALDDLLVDLIYFARAGLRSLTIYTRYPRAFADALGPPDRRSGWQYSSPRATNPR